MILPEMAIQGSTLPIPTLQPHGMLCLIFSALDCEVEQKSPRDSCGCHLLRHIIVNISFPISGCACRIYASATTYNILTKIYLLLLQQYYVLH